MKLIKIILICFLFAFMNYIPIHSSEKSMITNIFYVGGNGPGNYSTIQSAINDAKSGDTVFVYNGTYEENVVVNKTINLFGQDRNTTIINGNNYTFSVCLDAENITMMNFTITGGGYDGDIVEHFFYSGIRVIQSNNTIKNNIIKNNRLGILGVRVTKLTIHHNTFINDGIIFTPYENDGRPPIKLQYYLHDIYENNVNGHPLYYLKNSNNISISEKNLGQFIMVNCSDILVNNISIYKTDVGLQMAYCTNCVIENMCISESDGIWILKSKNNLFQNNNLSKNLLHGITIDYQSNNNIIKNNYITENRWVGVMIEWYSQRNLITNNIFMNNYAYNGYHIQAFENYWNSNFWDDWIGLKSPFFSFLPKIIYGSPSEENPRIRLPLAIDPSPLNED